MTRLLSPLACLGLMVGCATAPEPAAPIDVYEAPAALNSMHRPIRLSATAMGGILGGAAYRARAIEDVLLRNRADLFARGPISTADQPYERLVAQYGESARKAAETNRESGPINPAWRRYCNAGVNMTKADWQFVRQHGQEHGVPDSHAKDCVYPK